MAKTYFEKTFGQHKKVGKSFTHPARIAKN
jgi:hypothetical protein